MDGVKDALLLLYIYIHTYVHIYIYTYIHTYMYIYIYIFIWTYINKYIYIFIWIYTYRNCSVIFNSHWKVRMFCLSVCLYLSVSAFNDEMFDGEGSLIGLECIAPAWASVTLALVCDLGTRP